jgi:hypothetical protein
MALTKDLFLPNLQNRPLKVLSSNFVSLPHVCSSAGGTADAEIADVGGGSARATAPSRISPPRRHPRTRRLATPLPLQLVHSQISPRRPSRWTSFGTSGTLWRGRSGGWGGREAADGDVGRASSTSGLAETWAAGRAASTWATICTRWPAGEPHQDVPVGRR